MSGGTKNLALPDVVLGSKLGGYTDCPEIFRGYSQCVESDFGTVPISSGSSVLKFVTMKIKMSAGHQYVCPFLQTTS
jgi:hypothetical protein